MKYTTFAILAHDHPRKPPKTIRNTQLEDVFQKTLEFNNNYLKYLKQKLEEAKKIKLIEGCLRKRWTKVEKRKKFIA